MTLNVPPVALTLSLGAAALALLGGLGQRVGGSAEARPPAEVPAFIAPKEGALLVGEIEIWWRRAQAWYQAKGSERPLSSKAKRKQMRALTRAVGRGCYSCHVKGFKGYTDKGLISAQMMAISAEHDRPCEDCHVGARGLTTLGGRALLMWRYSVQEGLDCADCHPKKTRFKELNDLGEARRSEVERALLKLCEALGLPSELASPKTHTALP